MHPAVRAQRFRTGQGLAHHVLMAPATRALMPLHHTRVDGRIAQQGQDVRAPCFAIAGPHIAPPPLRRFFHLPRGNPYGQRRTQRGARPVALRQLANPRASPSSLPRPQGSSVLDRF